jgi:DNA-binding IclR family transcriptional regulator
MKQAPRAGVQAVRRAAGLLKAFTRAAPQRRLSELVRESGLSKSTTHRLLTTLEQEGLLARSADGEAYQPGPALHALAGLALGVPGLRAAARAELLALAAATAETATLEVRAGAEVLIVDEAVGPHVVGAMPSAGERWPLHATSTGKVLLAGLAEPARLLALPQALAAFTGRTLVDRQALLRELRSVAARGWATSVEELEPGFVALGAPVRDSRGEVVAALGVGGPRNRLNASVLARLARLVPEAAQRVSERLGFRPGAGAPRTTRNGKVGA